MAITGYQQPLTRALSYLDQLRITANAPRPLPPAQETPWGNTDDKKDEPPPYFIASPDTVKPKVETGIPPGGAIEPGTGNLIASDPNGNPITVAGAGDLFQMGDTVYRWSGHNYTKATAKEAKAYLNGDTTGTGSDHYATDVAAANEAANRAETIRSHRMQEAQDAINALTQRTQAAQTAKLDALPYAVGNMAYYPGLGPQSPAVSLGLADPFKVQGMPFDPNRVANVDPQQAQSDLAQLRSMAGY